ncbi:hypothetical protein VOLCADRAFT_95555 [Volvox carteri f. nagariensis]|uniref:Calcineurin-like phosphoesterase domain-containing protein n=1 Tax=Volvox carteri f. nagariensis TaxID=3068 RepID=D8U7X7_VOLCA|nr:uncharacterized protein VOLCADRAFT_95555 [Volvox carteri f. nagariensis]EFJ44170.1 hypothetical protein VOLCADRAFT_95555 [Volvox carteri f. nagariensis]|eukprot:XP_002954764.1 hypothetical protein VOLCADRAFT_95555 [Volvox carteri f. nagariensis]
MGSQALRTGFDLEEEERFFISGVEKAGRSRNTYEHQLRERKVFVGVLIAIGSLGLVALIIGLAWGLSRRKLDYVCPRSYDPSKTDLVFYVIGDWGRSGNDNQQKAARLMSDVSDVSQCMPPKFIIRGHLGTTFTPMGSQALRTGFDLEEEERFFISGVEKAGRSRNTYEHQLRERKVFVGVLIAIGSLGLVALIIGLAWGLSRRKLDYVCPRSYDPSKTDLVFYVIGDWGRSGNDNQQKAARLMSDVSQCMPPKFIISTGDNFYPRKAVRAGRALEAATEWHD